MIRKIYTDTEWELRFGKLDFWVSENRTVIVDPQWQKENIIIYELPILGKLAVNKNVVGDLVRILTQIELKGLDRYIDREDTRLNGGIYCARFNVGNKARLSRHSWGCPIDINPSTNRYNTKPNINMDIVKVFNDNGWAWFGDLRINDGMHFEPAKIMG